MTETSQSDLFTKLSAGGEGSILLPNLRETIHLNTTTLSRAVDGRARLNIENRHLLSEAGFHPGTHAEIKCGTDSTGDAFVLVELAKAAGLNTLKICGKPFATRSGSEHVGSRLDIRRQGLYEFFNQGELLLVAYLPGRLVITQLPVAKARRARWLRLLEACRLGEIVTGSLYSGLGTLDDAAQEGLAKAGLRSRTAFSNDRCSGVLDASLGRSNRTRRTIGLPIEEMLAINSGGIENEIPDLLIAGIPCTGASKLNVSTRDNPEEHDSAGHQVLHFAAALQKLSYRPSLILIENVVAWGDSVSCHMLRKLLADQGYSTLLVGEYEEGRYVGMLGSDFGDFERRRRMALVACPPELEHRLQGLFASMAKRDNPLTFGDVRVSENALEPGSYAKGAGMGLKEAKGWRNRIVEDSARSCGPVSAGVYRIRPEDPKFKHPTDPTKWRIPTPEEHARLKGHPVSLIEHLPFDTHAHTALGNGTTRAVWVEFFRALGEVLRTLN